MGSRHSMGKLADSNKASHSRHSMATKLAWAYPSLKKEKKWEEWKE
jgi:hypothetical protein